LDENVDNPDERYWQRTLEANGWVIAQVYAVPIMLIDGQVYVGGKRITNQSGNTADFLYRNGITGNVALVEIKIPVTPLLGSQYRNNVVNVSADLSGGLMQSLNAQRSLMENFTTLVSDDSMVGRPLSPRGLSIVGSVKLLQTHEQKASSEMFRNNQREIDIVTFDEMREKIDLMIELLKNVAK
jgi:hypothetical protein